jgi:hypothetical protein
VHTPDDVKKAHWVLGLHRVVQVLAWWASAQRSPSLDLPPALIRRVITKHMATQNSSLRAFYSGSAKAPGFLVDRCAGADAWLSGDYKKHCDEHGAANQTAIPLKWTKSKTQFNTEKVSQGCSEGTITWDPNPDAHMPLCLPANPM